MSEQPDWINAAAKEISDTLDRDKYIKRDRIGGGPPLTIVERCDIAASRDIDAEHIIGSHQDKHRVLQTANKRLVEVVKEVMKETRWLNGSYDFPTPRFIAMMQRAERAIADAEKEQGE